jgi:hypothetical protein
MVSLPREIKAKAPESSGLRRRLTDGTTDLLRDHNPKEDFAMSSTIQARFGEDAYPVGRFVLDRARVLGLTRTDLVRRLCYPDISKGHKALTGFRSPALSRR